MSDANPVADLAAKQAEGGAQEPVKQEEAKRDPTTGKFIPPVEKSQEAPKGDGGENFRALRREMKNIQKSVADRDDRIRLQEERINTLLDVMERRQAPAEDPLAHLAKDDPDRSLIERKIAPLLKRDGELASIKEELKKLREEQENSRRGSQKLAEFNEIMSEIAEDRGLPAEVANAVRKVILEKRVGGDTYEDAFENAVTYLKGAGKYPGNGQKTDAGKKQEGTERTVVGGVMPQQAGAPVTSDDFRTLRKHFQDARAEGNGDDEARAFQSLLAKVREEQGRGG